MESRGSKFIIKRCVTFNEVRKGSKSKDIEMKVLKTMTEKTQFEVEVYVRETMDYEEVKAHNPSSSERYFIVVSECHLTYDKVRWEIAPSKGYVYDEIGCYALNVAERLKMVKKLYLWACYTT